MAPVKQQGNTTSNLNGCLLLQVLPTEIHVHILTFLRAYDLSAVQLSCKYFHDHTLTETIVKHFAEHVYPEELTNGYDTPMVHPDSETKMSYQHLRNMEMLVVARVLSRPEPVTGFYVSKSWCRTALKWLELQQEELQREAQQHNSTSNHHHSKKKKKMSKKQQRIRNRRLSDAHPPWPNVNSELLCPHSNLKGENNSKSARARRKLLDKQAWKVLKKIYPESTALDSANGECLQCALEQETDRKADLDRLEAQKAERRQPLSCPIVRGIYTRSRGVPINCLKPTTATTDSSSPAMAGATLLSPITCPLVPGLYHAIPRAWLHQWRRYLKQGGEKPPCAPDSTALLCHAHRLPLIPPHLEAYLYGETSNLLSTTSATSTTSPVAVAASPSTPSRAGTETGLTNAVGRPIGTMASITSTPNSNTPTMDRAMVDSLRAAGMSPADVASQRMAMMTLERQNSNNVMQQQTQEQLVLTNNEQLDRENGVVVEIITEEEYEALSKWWPKIHSSFVVRFAVSEETTRSISTFDSFSSASIAWSTPPCRECDASSRSQCCDLHVRNRARSKMGGSNAKKKSSGTKKKGHTVPAKLEY
mmetsp:Transcript_7796/g.11194  ORF Transcript_7796/g.11194 Transcript_7796/m.11194 type:complete len:590 (-) Transcript_7796:46-1815(-)